MSAARALAALLALALLAGCGGATAPPARALEVTVIRFERLPDGGTALALLVANPPANPPVTLRLADITGHGARGEQFRDAADSAVTIPPGGVESVSLTFPPAAGQLSAVVVAPAGVAATVLTDWGR